MTMGFLDLKNCVIEVEHHEHPAHVETFTLEFSERAGGPSTLAIGSVTLEQLDQLLYSAKRARDVYVLTKLREEPRCSHPTPTPGTQSEPPASGSSGPQADPCTVIPCVAGVPPTASCPQCGMAIATSRAGKC